MSRISDLIARMELIPDKERRANQLGEMIAVRDKLRDSADSAEHLRTLSATLEEIEGAEFVDKAKQDLARASNAAVWLKARLEDGSGFERNRMDDTLIKISERLSDVNAAVTKGWRGLVDRQVVRFKPLADVAERAALPGANKLNAAIAQLESWGDNPPATLQKATAYAADEARIPASIGDLGLEGRAGKFMVDAARCRARAKDLQDTEVRAFLDGHPAVWSMLKVGI